MQRLSQIISDVEHKLKTIGENNRAEGLTKLRELLPDSKLRVVVFGEFNHGKSTLINALLGRIVLPAKLIPTTGHITQIVFGTDEEVRVRFLDNRSEVCKLDRLDSFSSLNHDGVAREDVELIEVAVNNQLLKNELILIDTPGLNEHETQTHRAKNAIAKADLVLLVLNAQGVLNSDERSLAADWLNRKLGKPVVPVVNFMNRLDDRDKSEVRTRLQTWCHDNLPSEFSQSWFEVNALGNLKYALDNQSVATGDDFDDLRKVLSNLPKTEKQNLQRRARYGQLLAEMSEIEAENEVILKRLQADTAKVKRERIALQQELQEHLRRFKTESAVLHERLELAARKSSNTCLEILTNSSLKDKNKEILEANAGKWYEQKLSKAVKEIEGEAKKLLAELSGKESHWLEPLTIQERMTLNARLSVGELPLVDASDSAVNWGLGIGATVGTFVFPGVGTVIGGIIGGMLTSFFGSSEPDYVAAYSGKAREAWATDSQKVINIALEQFDARAAGMKKEITTQLKEVKALLALPQSDELQQREVLKATLENCQRELQSVFVRKNK